MHPTAFLNLADRLIQNEKRPEGFRSATSRAYYAAHLSALAFLGEMGITLLGGPHGHEDVCRHLEGSADEALLDAGQLLRDLRGSRNEADYDLTTKEPESEANARLHFEEASTIIVALSKCRRTKGQGPYEAVVKKIRAAHKVIQGMPT
jgi:hypothetical protein